MRSLGPRDGRSVFRKSANCSTAGIFLVVIAFTIAKASSGGRLPPSLTNSARTQSYCILCKFWTSDPASIAACLLPAKMVPWVGSSADRNIVEKNTVECFKRVHL
jgi:hypothetical protein